jgi:hypothetical protein
MRQTLSSDETAEAQLQQLQWLSDIAAQQAPTLQPSSATSAQLSADATADLRALSMMHKFVRDTLSIVSTSAAIKAQRVSLAVSCKISTDQ